MSSEAIIVATRGSALALAQTTMIVGQCRSAFPELDFKIKIIKTTGDKLQTAALTVAAAQGSKGLFTKELEMALLDGAADLAVHSLKDLPTELPDGLVLGAVSKRADVRDVLIFRDAEFFSEARDPGSQQKRALQSGAGLRDFPRGATIATSSTRRQAQLLALRQDLRLVPVRGNVGTRLKKLAEQGELDGIVLAAAGLERLHFSIGQNGRLQGDGVPPGLIGVHLSLDEMLPCVGQGALGIETRASDSKVARVCEYLNDLRTQQCVTAERSFLQGMGGGCLSPVAAFGEILGAELRLRALSFRDGTLRRGESRRNPSEAVELGQQLAFDLK